MMGMSSGRDQHTEWATGTIWQPIDVDVKVNPFPVRTGCASDVSAYGAFLGFWENGLIGDAGWVPLDLCCRAELARSARHWSWGLGADESEAGQGSNEKCGMHYCLSLFIGRARIDYDGLDQAMSDMQLWAGWEKEEASLRNSKWKETSRIGVRNSHSPGWRINKVESGWMEERCSADGKELGRN